MTQEGLEKFWEDQKAQIDDLGEPEVVIDPEINDDLPPKEDEPPVVAKDEPPVEPPVEPKVEGQELPKETPPVAEPTETEKTIAELKEQIAALQNTIKEVAVKPAETPSAEDKFEIEKYESAAQEWVKDEDDFTEIFRDHKAFNKLIDRIKQEAVREALTLTPKAWGGMMTETIRNQVMIESFYSENDDLLPYAEIVTKSVNEVGAKNPEWSIKQVFSEGAALARKKVGLPSREAIEPPITPEPKVKDKSRAFPPGSARSGKRPPVPERLNDLQKELDEL